MLKKVLARRSGVNATAHETHGCDRCHKQVVGGLYRYS